MADWTARRILKELSDHDLRQRILSTFFRKGEDHAREIAISLLSKSLRFREGTLRKTPADRKAELLASRLSAPELEESLEMALMTYHTTEAKTMLGEFLDYWKIPHEEGSIEVEEYDPPTAEAVDSAVASLRDRFPAREIAVYLATAGLLMGGAIPQWREATWPAVNRLATDL